MATELQHPRSRVLVVDDKPNNLSLVTSLLKPFYEILLANNGEKALFVAREKVPDLILLDIMMPGMSGFDVCEELKKDARTAGIPVIFLTARHDGEDFEKAYDIGAVDYVTKPINAKELIARVRTHLTISDQRNNLVRLNHEISQSNEQLEAQVERRTKDLVKVLARLEDQNRGLSRFSHIISHNLRGPVASAIGLVGLFNMENMSDPTNGQVIGRLSAMVRDIDSILKELSAILDIRDNLIRKSEVFLVDQELDAVLGELSGLLSESGGKVTREILTPQICLHRPFVHQILHQMLHNAIQFRSPERGLQIHVMVRPSGEPGQIEFSVSDNGIGIEAESLQKIFEPYKRLHYSKGGRGLGLYLVNTMVEALEGKVLVASEPGVGTTFSVLLPQDLLEQHKSA